MNEGNKKVLKAACLEELEPPEGRIGVEYLVLEWVVVVAVNNVGK